MLVARVALSPARCWWLEWLCHLDSAGGLSGFVTCTVLVAWMALSPGSATSGCAQLVGDSPVPVEWHRPTQTVPGSRDVPFLVPPGEGDAAVPSHVPSTQQFICRAMPALAGHRALGQCRGLSVCLSVCRASHCHRPCLSVPSAPSRLCFIRVFPKTKRNKTKLH